MEFVKKKPHLFVVIVQKECHLKDEPRNPLENPDNRQNSELIGVFAEKRQSCEDPNDLYCTQSKDLHIGGLQEQPVSNSEEQADYSTIYGRGEDSVAIDFAVFEEVFHLSFVVKVKADEGSGREENDEVEEEDGELVDDLVVKGKEEKGHHFSCEVEGEGLNVPLEKHNQQNAPKSKFLEDLRNRISLEAVKDLSHENKDQKYQRQTVRKEVAQVIDKSVFVILLQIEHSLFGNGHRLDIKMLVLKGELFDLIVNIDSQIWPYQIVKFFYHLIFHIFKIVNFLDERQGIV